MAEACNCSPDCAFTKDGTFRPLRNHGCRTMTALWAACAIGNFNDENVGMLSTSEGVLILQRHKTRGRTNHAVLLAVDTARLSDASLKYKQAARILQHIRPGNVEADYALNGVVPYTTEYLLENDE